MEKAYFGGGCFWCLEAVFLLFDGVEKVSSGYMGGTIKNPCYREVCSGRTGHAEVVEITYDASKIDYVTLLTIFFTSHDPTTLNRQGNDKGTQYRSAIFCVDDKQMKEANEIINKFTTETVFSNPIVTEVNPMSPFYEAEEEHGNYYNQNTEQPYCSYVISPKVKKVKETYKHLLKK